jgi:hypothetical protein
MPGKAPMAAAPSAAAIAKAILLLLKPKFIESSPWRFLTRRWVLEDPAQPGAPAFYGADVTVS